MIHLTPSEVFMNRDYIKHKIDHNLHRLATAVKWIVFALLSGAFIGLIGSAFFFCLDLVTKTRASHPQLIFLLPLGGVVIVGLYHILHDEHDTGTNLVLSAIHSGDEIPLKMAPLIFLSTIITHLCGGSAGREGAALQLGGSLGNGLGKLFHFNEKDQHIMIMAGMSAAFSALFGTPMAAAIFSMEVISVGIMHYSALVPCVISSLVAHGVAGRFGIVPELFPLTDAPALRFDYAVILSVLAVLCALVSILFCVILHQTGYLYRKFIKNPYLRAITGGVLLIVLTLLVGDQRYNGTGIASIADCMNGQVRPEAFLLKMIFTALTLGAGFKGGEIVPTFFIGASFGCLFANLTGMAPDICTAIGMTAVFCGVTNCPISSLLISFELFGFQGMPYFLLAVALSYMLSGYFGLYSGQKIMYSKFQTNFINKQTH